MVKLPVGRASHFPLSDGRGEGASVRETASSVTDEGEDAGEGEGEGES